MKTNESLNRYLAEHIIPRYEHFDAAHQVAHVRTVMEESLKLAAHYDVDADMVLAIAAFHDTGLVAGRARHHIESGHIVRTDPMLPLWFTAAQVEVMAQAVEDHRASATHEPRSIYGKIVAEADRLIDSDTIIRRTVQYGLKYFPEMDKEQQWERTWQHLREKYDVGGYLKLWIPESPNATRLEAFRRLMTCKEDVRRLYDYCYDQLTDDSQSDKR